MASIRELLEAEIEASSEFTRSNYGMAVGDSYREMVEDITQSNKVNANLMVGILMVGLTGKQVAESMKEISVDSSTGHDAVRYAITRNQETFKGALEMLYWGIQIGRKLQREESVVLAGLDKEKD